MVIPALTVAVTRSLIATASHMLVIIDPSVEAYEQLAAGVIAGADVYILDGDRDGITQITELLQQYSHRYPISDSFSLHIVSHGSPGCLYLGNACLSLETIAHYAPDLQSWFPFPLLLSPFPQLLLYGCNVATGDAGSEFLENLHHLTGASIAASNTRTGNMILGGDWNLAVRIGEITPILAFETEAIATYAGVLDNALHVQSVNYGQYGGATIQNSDPTCAGSFTVEMRMKMNSVSALGYQQQYTYIAGKGNDSWRILYYAPANEYRFYVGGTNSLVSAGSYTPFTPALINDGQWHHLAVTYNGTTANLYIDGNVRASVAASPSINSNPITFGDFSGNYGGIDYLTDDVRIWNYARGQFDGIIPYMNQPVPANSSGLQSYFTFENYDSYGERCSDITGSNRYVEIRSSVGGSIYSLNQSPTGMSLNSTTTPENSVNGSVVGTLYTSDPDSGDSFTYTLLNDAGGRFIASGDQIRVLNSSLLDYETSSSYTIRVRTTDRAGAFYDQDFTINVSNVNEAPTSVVLSNANVDENAAVDTIVGSLSSTDPDTGNTFTYSLVSGTGDADNGVFELVGNQLKLKESADFEGKPSYSIRVRTTDQNGLFTEKSIPVAVNDRNEVPTSLSLSSDSVNENITSGTTAATFITLDPDAVETLAYSLVSGNGDTDNAAFQIIGNQIYFVNSPDYETKLSYSLRVKVTDKGGLTFEQPLTFTINDVNEAPTSLTLSNTIVGENSNVGVAIGTFTATDPDTNETYTYSLESGTGDTDNAAFQIVGNQIYFTSSPDYEAQLSYSIRVGVTDAGGLSREQTFTVTVNDINDAPTDISLSDTAIADGILANSVVGSFSATDQDVNEQFTYDLVSGFGDTDNSGFTLIDNELRINRSPNATTQPDYSIRVRTIDKAGASFTKVLRLIVNSNNAAPTDLTLNGASLAENNLVNALVGALSTTDPDTNNTFTYSLIGGASATDNAAFAIAGNDLILKNPANFESKSGYSVRIRTTDQAGSSFDKAFSIAVNDINEAPTNLALSPATIPENSLANSLIGTLSSTDPDANNSFIYSLVSGAGDTDNGVFAIATDQLSLQVSPNFEAKPNYKIRVRTTDQDGVFFEKTLTVRVADVNEAPINLSLSNLSLNENVSVNTVVGKLASVDPDINNTFAYSLVAGAGDTDNAVFSIAGNELRIQASPDFETKSSYNLRVRTTDQNGLLFEKPLTIQVKNLNEAPTGFTLSSNKLNEGAASGTAIGTLRTTDLDAGNTFTYSLVAGMGSTDNTNFAIVGNQLRFQTAPAGTAPPTYSIRIRTTDQNGLSFEESVPIQVNAAPTDILLSNNRTTENDPANTVVGNLAAIDRDAGNTFTYQLVTGAGDSGNSAFAIVNNQLQIKTPLDFEKQASYSIRVQATDQDGAKFQKSLEITVGNINEKPTSLKLGYSSIPENQVPFIPIVGVDPDMQDRGSLIYTLVNGVGSENNNAFSIHGNNLVPKSPANYEQKSNYSVRLRAQDIAGEYLEQSLTLAIKDVNEAPTDVILSNNHITENTLADSVIGLITGADPDAGDSFTYSLAGSSPDNSAFSIVGNQIVMNFAPDFEARSSYDIWIQATDRNGLSNARPFTINIDDVAETAIPNSATSDTKASLKLDGVNDYVRIAKESTFDLTNAITVEGWFKVDSWTKPWQSIITKGDSAWRISRSGAGRSLEFAIGSGASGQFLQGSKAVDDGRWHHVAAVYDGAAMKLYIDGALDGEKAASGPIATNDYEVWLGANAEATGREFAGQLDEFRVWNVARSQADIQTDKRRSIDPGNPGLVGYWKLNDSTGTTVASSKAGDNNGTLVNGDGINWNDSSPVLLAGGSSNTNSQQAENEFATWSQLSAAIDQFYSGNPLRFGTKDILKTMFDIFESGETDPTNTVTAIARFESDRVVLISARDSINVDLAKLVKGVSEFANISAPDSALSALSNIPLPLLDSTLTISNLNSVPAYGFSTKVFSENKPSELNFLKVIQDYLNIKDFTLTAHVDPIGLSATLSGDVVADKTLIDVDGFQLVFLGGTIRAGLETAIPTVALKPKLKLKNYDPFQANEPDLTLDGNVSLDPFSFKAGLKFSAGGNVWKNPFGIPDSEIRNVGLELIGSYKTPYLEGVKVLGDLKFGNYDVKAALIVYKPKTKDTTDTTQATDATKVSTLTKITDAAKGVDLKRFQNAVALTVNQPIYLTDLLGGPVRSFALKQLASNFEAFDKGLKFLNGIVDLKICSIDSNNDGVLDPLISVALLPTDVFGVNIKSGLYVNGKISAWGKDATLVINADPFSSNPTLSGALSLSRIDWGFLKLTGVNQPNLNVSLQIDRNQQFLKGSGSLELFGRTVGAADFSFDKSQININKFSWILGVLGFELNSFQFNTANFTGSGSGKLYLFGNEIANGSFALNKGNFSAAGQLGVSVLGSNVSVNAQVSLGNQGNHIRLSGSVLGHNFDLLDSSIDAFVNQFKSPGDLNKLIEPKVRDFVKNDVVSFFRRAIDGYIADGTVFFDANLNGILDSNEPFTVTDAGGGFNLDVALAKFDINKNKQIDISEGQYVLTGGTDISTGLPMATPLSAVFDSKGVISPLTTIVAGMAQQGIAPQLAQTQVKKAFGLSADVDLTSFDPLQAIAKGDAKGIAIFASMVMVQNTIVQAAKFANGVSNATLDQLANGAIAAIANQLKGGNPVDFGKAGTIQAIVQGALTKAAASDPSLNLAQLTTLASTAAQVIAQGNQIVQEQVVSGRPLKEIALNITRAQAVSVGQIAANLPQLAAGKIAVADFLIQNTREAILNRMTAVQVNDPTLRPVMPNKTLLGTNRNDLLTGDSGNDVLSGKKGNDYLFGRDGNDRLQGNGGNDILTGGEGNDILTGGKGKDRFALNVTEIGKDKITDFRVKEDLLKIGGLSTSFVVGKPIRANQFHLGNKALDKSDRLIYSQRTGALFYDADGFGGSQQTQIAHLAKGLQLTTRDIVVG